MPATYCLAPRISVAHSPRLGHASQDRHLVLADAVAVLDGATNPDEPPGRDGGWYAERLVEALATRLADPSRDLADLLAEAISEVAERHGLRAGTVPSPSCTVTLLRWNEATVEGLVLADSPLLVRTVGDRGRVDVLHDTRLDTVIPQEEAELRALLGAGAGFGPQLRAVRRRIHERLRVARNQDGGFWVAQADPAAAHQALRRSWPADEVESAAVFTDGASALLEVYGACAGWPELLDEVVTHGPAAAIRRVRAIEQTDPSGQRWPRSKVQDDATVVTVRFGQDVR